MTKKMGIAAIIFGVAALITAISTAIVNIVSLKWTIDVYKPFGRIIKKSEPLFDKAIDYYTKELNDELKD